MHRTRSQSAAVKDGEQGFPLSDDPVTVQSALETSLLALTDMTPFGLYDVFVQHHECSFEAMIVAQRKHAVSGGQTMANDFTVPRRTYKRPPHFSPEAGSIRSAQQHGLHTLHSPFHIRTRRDCSTHYCLWPLPHGLTFASIHEARRLRFRELSLHPQM